MSIDTLSAPPVTSPAPGADASVSAASVSAAPASARHAAQDAVTVVSAAALRAPRVVAVLALQARALRAPRAAEAASAVADELARSLGCDRISIGFLPPGGEVRRLQLAAMSHTVELAPRQALARALAAAMAEAAEQRLCIAHPPAPGAVPMASAAHQALAELNGGLAVYTVPLHDPSRAPDDAGSGDAPSPVAGALLFERAGGFDPALIDAAQDAASFVGPILVLRHRLDQPVSGRLADAVQRAAPRRVGGRLALRRGHVLALAAAAVVAAIGAWPGTQRVVASAQAQGLGQQLLAAPFDGYIAEAQLRPGAAVQAGEVLLTLQDRDLALEAARWSAETTRLDRGYREAQTTEDAAAIVIARAQLEQAQAQLGLAELQLERTRLRAPFDGLLLAGDHTQSIGAAVRRGQELLTVAPTLAYRIVAEVDEADLGRLQPGQAGQVLFGAVDGEALPLRVTRIAPVASVIDGRNVVEVEARLVLDGPPPALRPGLRGVVRLEADTAPLAVIAWTRLSQWLRLTSWRLFG